MDPNPKKFPILSFVMSKIGQISTLGSPSSSEIEVEQPLDLALEEGTLLKQMPHLRDPNLISSMGEAISDVAKTRSILKDLGPRPDHESLDFARARIAEIESRIEMEGSDSPDLLKEILPYKAVLQVEEMHAAYEEQLRAAEERLERMYGSSATAPEVRPTAEDDMVDEEVVAVLREVGSGKEVERVNLSERELRIIPEAMGRIHSLKTMNLSDNQLEAIPDSIAGLENLVELNASTNLLVSLPDSIGLLFNLRILNVSKNKLKALPDSISCCRSLVELDASFNDLTYLPTNIGHELVKLEKLSVQLNKLRSLPTSICEMKSLRYLDAHFNALHRLPHEIGRLLNLEVLNVGSNFSDLTEIPDSVGDLHNLRELDLSNNQIHVLPYTIRRLDKLRKLNLDQNPLVVPPLEVAEKGTEVVKDYMARKWLDLLAEEERVRVLETEHQFQTGWLARSKSWLNNWVGDISERVSGTTAKSEADSYLNQQL